MPSFISPEADTITTSRPYSLWPAIRFAALANTKRSHGVVQDLLTIDLTCAASQPAHIWSCDCASDPFDHGQHRRVERLNWA